MKKLMLAIITCLALVGCGSRQGTDTLYYTPDISVVGNSNVNPSYIAIDRNITKNTTPSNGYVSSLAWNVDANKGGSGTIALGFGAFGQDCSTVTPLETLNITAGLTTTNAPLSANTMATLTTYLKQTGQYRLCGTVNDAVLTSPIDIHINFPTGWSQPAQ